MFDRKMFLILIIPLFIFCGCVHTSTPKINAIEIDHDQHLVKYDNGTIVDTKNNLMWVSNDNGQNIDWNASQKYCNDFILAEYDDWRLPTVKELETLFSQTYKNNSGYQISTMFKITGGIWAADKYYKKCKSSKNRLWVPNFSFQTGFVSCITPMGGFEYHRAIPVRSLK